MPLCVATFTSLLDSSEEHHHGRHIVQEFTRLENYKVFTTFACVETVTDGKVKVKSSNCNGHVCNLGCRTFWEKQILKINQISLCTILWGKISKPHLTDISNYFNQWKGYIHSSFSFLSGRWPSSSGYVIDGGKYSITERKKIMELLYYFF